jgi:hypothetical protein
MGDSFGWFPSSGATFEATCGTTTTAGYIRHWTIVPPLTMNDEPRKTWVSTKPREDPVITTNARYVPAAGYAARYAGS